MQTNTSTPTPAIAMQTEPILLVGKKTNTAKIIKLEIGDYGLCEATLSWDVAADLNVEDFDLAQLGEVSSSFTDRSGQGTVLFTNEAMDLKIGDSITDETGGLPIIGDARSEAKPMPVLARREGDYRDVFSDKHGQRRGNI